MTQSLNAAGRFLANLAQHINEQTRRALDLPIYTFVPHPHSVLM